MAEMKSITMADAFKAAGWDAPKDSDGATKITKEDANEIVSKNADSK